MIGIFIISALIALIIITIGIIKRKSISKWINENKKKAKALGVALTVLGAGLGGLGVTILTPTSGTSYYVSNDGDDDNNGLTPETAWRTIGKVNDELNGGVISTGDDIYFNRGDSWIQSDGLSVRVGGSISDPMIIGAYGTGDKPIITHSETAASNDHCIYFGTAGLSWVIIENLNLSNAGERGIFVEEGRNANNMTIRNLEVWNPDAAAINVANWQHFIIENCVCKDIDSDRSGSITIQGRTTGQEIMYGIVRNCTIINGWDGVSLHFETYESPGQIGDYHWVDNCTIDHAYEEPVDCVGGVGVEHILIENCDITNLHKGIHIGHNQDTVTLQNCTLSTLGDAASNGITLTSTRNTRIRYNTIYGKNGLTHLLSKDQNQYAPRETNNVKIYNNNFISTGTSELNNFNDGDADNLDFKNNIYYSTQDSAPSQYVEMVTDTGLTIMDCDYTNNIWWRGDGIGDTEAWEYSSGSHGDFDTWLSQSEVTGDFIDDPEFVNEAQEDFITISEDSPCIDAGEWLTETVGSGEDTYWVTVEDVSYFFGGLPNMGPYPYEQVPGDTVFVGNDDDLVIIDINYDNDSFMVDRLLTWGNGEDVSLDNFLGDCVDIGVDEYDSDVTYTATIRNDGVDYFTWLDSNMSASDVDDYINNFDEATEYIAVWENGTWSSTDANWIYWYGDSSGTDFDANTFDVIKIYLTDSGTQNIVMTENADMDYDAQRQVSLTKGADNKGYNYIGYTNNDVSTLSAVIGKSDMSTGESGLWWDRTVFSWRVWIVGFSSTNYNTAEHDVFIMKVSTTRTINIGD